MRILRRPLSLPRIFAFAGVGIPLAAIGLPMAVFVVPMYTTELGLGTSTTGLIFMLLRFWDLMTDPVMGWLVDKRPTAFGRFKHWIIGSVPILMLSGFFLFMPAGETVSPVYLTLCLAVFWLGFTMLQTPYAAWVPSIATDYDDRSRIFFWREIFNTATLLIVLIIPSILANQFGFGLREQVLVMGIILLISLPLTVLMAVLFVPDFPPNPNDTGPDITWPVIKDILSDPAIWRVFAVEILIGIAIASTGGTFLFAAQWGFGVTGYSSVILLTFFIAGFAMMPGWLWFSRKTDKHIAVAAVAAWSSVTFLIYLPLSALGGGAILLLSAAIITGLGYGSAPVLIRSMMADIIERERIASGESRAGIYYSLLSGAHKTGASFAIGIPYILLGSVVGFDPSSDNSDAAINGLMLVFVGVPVVAYGASALIIRDYPLNRSTEASDPAPG